MCQHPIRYEHYIEWIQDTEMTNTVKGGDLPYTIYTLYYNDALSDISILSYYAPTKDYVLDNWQWAYI